MPFVRVGGESAFRLDLESARLHALGASFTLSEAHVVLLAILFLTCAFLSVTVVLGRVFCGWSCPQTVLTDLTRLLEPEKRAKPRRWRRPVGLALAAFLSALVAASVVFWFVEPYGFLARLLALRLGPIEASSWAAMTLILFLDLAYLRAGFCKTACPYGKLQGVLFDRSTLLVAYDERRAKDCIDCDACVRVCPTGIDIRDGLQMECIACAACVDACTPVMRKLSRAENLVGYAWGSPGQKPRPFRPVSAALLGGTFLLAAGLLAVLLGRSTLALEAMSDPAFQPRRVGDGRVMAAYSVALENRSRLTMLVNLELASETRRLDLHPDAVSLAPGERRQLRVVASGRLEGPGSHDVELKAEGRLVGVSGRPERQVRALSLFAPRAP